MDTVFRREVLDPLKARSSTRIARNEWLGIPYADIQPRVLEMGRADFSTGYMHASGVTISAEDKVALYCVMNLRSHFYASLATFDAHRADIAAMLSATEPVLFVDLGCGPGTSGLAFAEHLNGVGTFDYAPQDSAQPMLDRAATLIGAAKSRGIGGGAIGTYVTTANLPHRRVIFNASYLFASAGLVVDPIVQVVRDTAARCDAVLFIYTNSIDARANVKWKQFCAALGIADPASQETVQYKNQRFDQTPPKSISFMRAVVRVR